MTAASFLRDITAFSVQLALVAMGMAVLLKVVRIPASARYLGLRLALVTSLVAPWLLRAPEVQAPAATTAVTQATFIDAVSAGSAPSAAVPPAAPPARSLPAIPWMQVGFGALLIGIAARVVWLSMGVLRLLRLRQEGAVVDAAEYAELQQQIGTRATIAQVTALAQPATFGVRRPVVLLPDALDAAPVSLRRAVVAHELFHVRRRDWLAVLTEEIVRTMLWFHPAIHWMTAQIQLAREEIVDELTVRATGDRRTYVEALLAFADTPRLNPAPAFAQRRQLFHRIVSVSKEKVMSRPRIVASAAVLIAAVSGANWYASTLFPIMKAAQVDVQAPALAAQATAQRQQRIDLNGDVVLRQGNLVVRGPSAITLLNQPSAAASAVEPVRPVTPENPIPRRTRGVAPVRPPRFADMQVVISPLVTLDRSGRVLSVARDACEISGGANSTREDVCDAFFEPTAAAIRQWRYERPVQAPLQFYVHVRYQPATEPTVTQSAESYKAYARDVRDWDGQNAFDEQRRAIEERLLSERLQDRATRERANDALTNRLSELIDRLRELERAQRVMERGLLANSDRTTLQRELARLSDDLVRVEEQVRNERVQATGGDQARIEELLRSARERLQEQAVLQRQFQAGVDSQGLAEERARAAAEQLREAARRFDDPNRGQAPQTTSTRVNREPAPANDSARPLVLPDGRLPLRIGDTEGITRPVPLKTVKPEHPSVAMKARVTGTVVVEALVDEQGRVAAARVMRSIPLLDQAALDAVRQWQFRPALLKGEPVAVLIQIELDFALK